MSLTADKEVTRKESGFQSFPVSAGETIYKGALVCLDADGYLVPAADTAGYKFAGIAYEKKDNALGSDGDLWCRVYTEGVHQLVCTDITQPMVGQMMYVRDDQTVDDTSTNYVAVGILVEYIGAASGWVDIGQRGLTKDAITGEQIADDSVAKEHLDSAIKYLKLQRSTAVLREILNGNDLPWTDLDIDTLITVPVGAIAVILETYVIDAGATPTLGLRKKGEEVNDWQTVRNSAQVAGLAHESIAIVEFDDDHKIEYRLQTTAGAGTASFYLKLLGWVMQP